MKKIQKIGIVCFLFTTFSSAQEILPTAKEIMNTAYQSAKKENKNVFLMFTASWCTWCHRMDENIRDKLCKEFFDTNYIITHLSVNESKESKHLENPGAHVFLVKLKGKNQGIPFWVIFDVNGNVLENSLDSNGSNLGCPATKEEVNQFMSKLKNTSELNEKQLEIINEVFVKKSRKKYY